MKLALGLLLSSLALSACISKDLRALDDTFDDPPSLAVIADRGASTQAPENTLAAFDKAQDVGARACATEVQLTKDGKLVLFGDATLDEKTSLKGKVQSHTWRELAKIDVAPWFARRKATTTADVKATAAKTPNRVRTSGAASARPSKKAQAGGTHTAPRRSRTRTKRKAQPSHPLTHLVLLSDLFERYGMTFAYNIELKGSDEKTPELALKTAKEYGLENNVTFVSSDVDSLVHLKKLDEDVSLCYSIDEKKTPDVSAEIVRAHTLGFTEVSVNAAVMSEDHVKQAKDLGLKIVSRGADTEADMNRAIQAGASGIITRRPERLLQILQTQTR